jgi:hypothetical protein
MTARRDAPTAKGVRGGTMRHVPVLLLQVLQALAPKGRETYIDGTFGAWRLHRRHPRCGA